MSTLILGGGSQIGLRLAELLQGVGKPVIFASRSGARIPAGATSVQFDWDDPATFDAAFALGQEIDYVYLLGPIGAYDPLAKVQPFIDLAVSKGVKRFVLLSAGGEQSDKGPDSKEMGKVHTYLDDQGLDYVALRPTWFSENLSRYYSYGIKEESLIENVVEKGPVGFIAIEDIAQAAFKAITDVDALPNKEPILVGPDLVSYQDVAATLTEVLGHKITYKIISVEEKIRRYIESGIPEDYAIPLARAEKTLDEGFDLKNAADPRALRGKIGIREWIKENKAAFI